MVMKVTRVEVNAALEAWKAARDKAALEWDAYGVLLRNHKTLIDSMRENGYSAAKVAQEFDAILSGHHDAVLNSWTDMDRKCAEYRKLKTQFDMQ